MDEPEVSIDDASYRSLSLDMGEPDKRLNSWKGTSINLFQMIHAHMSIALRGRQARMAEHFLYRPQVRTIAKHMRCETMTQSMRRDCRAHAGSRKSALQDHLDAAGGQSAAAKDRHVPKFASDLVCASRRR